MPRPARGPRNDAPPLPLRRTPPASVLPPLPLKKRGKKKKKKNPTTPARGSGCLRLAGVRSRPPPGPAGFRDPPADAGSSPVPGAAKSRTSVTWIFSREGAATPSFRARSVRNRRTHAEHGVPACGPVTNSSLYRSPARFPGRLEGPPEGIFFFFFFGSWKGAAREKPQRWMLLSCAANASCERSAAPGRARRLRRIVLRSRKGAAGSAPARWGRGRPRADSPQQGQCLLVLPAAVDAA